MGNFDKSGTELVSEGQFYTQVATTAGQLIKAAPGRVARINPVVGTGAVTVYDNALGNTSGNVIFTVTAVVVGTPLVVSCPTNLGISIVVAASTTVNIIWT